jgi:FkbM family methyltransferase
VLTLWERWLGRVAAKGWLFPRGHIAHHPIFAAFPPQPAPRDGVDTDYLGVRTRDVMLPPHWISPPLGDVPSLPPFDEEYFEWIDILEAVQAARGSFTMVEVGAGYARWCARACAAARRRGLEVRVGVVEAEPQHVLWAREHLAAVGIAGSNIEWLEAAVGAEPGETVFLVEMPEGRPGNTPREWYGQAVTWAAMQDATDTGRAYCGKPLLQMPEGWLGVKVAVQTLSPMLERFDVIDLVDFDVQGAETDVIAASLAPLTARVRRVHVGTHSREIDAALPRILRPAGWRCVQSYPCLRWNRTPYGWICFNDGVQTWVNPRLT